jgi:hypothetical protein
MTDRLALEMLTVNVLTKAFFNKRTTDNIKTGITIMRSESIPLSIRVLEK